MPKGRFRLSFSRGGKTINKRDPIAERNCSLGWPRSTQKKRFKKNYQKILRIKKKYYHMRA